MGKKVMMSKGDRLMIADDMGLIEIDVLMHGVNRCQLEVHAAKDRKITYIESEETKNRPRPPRKPTR